MTSEFSRPLRRVGARADTDDSEFDPLEVEYSRAPDRSVRRAAVERHEGLHPDEVANKSGNYIFSFGAPGSGKTTFQWFLMRYLMEYGDFVTRIDVPEKANTPDWEGRRILNEWKTQWVEGRFPESTGSQESDIREVTLEVRPMQGEKTPCKLSFLEISGELLRMVDPTMVDTPRLADTIHAYLSNEKIRFLTVLMLHPDDERNDNLFASFMSYLDRIHPGIKSRMSIAIIVSKPEESLRKLQTFGDREGRTDYFEFDDAALHAYVDAFASEAYQTFRSWPEQRRSLMCSLYIGKIDREAGEAILRKPDYENIAGIFGWIYTQFTGKRLGLTFWQRAFGRLGGWR